MGVTVGVIVGVSVGVFVGVSVGVAVGGKITLVIGAHPNIMTDTTTTSKTILDFSLSSKFSCYCINDQGEFIIYALKRSGADNCPWLPPQPPDYPHYLARLLSSSSFCFQSIGSGAPERMVLIATLSESYCT